MGYIYPFIEIGVGILFAARVYLEAATLFSILLLSFGAIGIYSQLKDKMRVTCACLGGFFSIPLTWVTFWENLLMAFMAAYMLLKF